MGDSGKSESSNALHRNQLAQLCKGFLVLSDNDKERAKGFLVTFLAETTKVSSEDNESV